jgi:hypothetical protein
MSLITFNVPGIESAVSFQQISNNEWTGMYGYALRITIEDDNRFNLIDKDPVFQQIEDDYLLNLFIDAYTQFRKKELDETASGVEDDTDGSNEGNALIPRPDFDPEQIRVDTKVFSILDVMRFIDKGRIDLSPDFQRYFVWKDVTKQSRLIESLLLRIPLPVFYLSEDKDGLYQVVDGLQRLSTIHRFIKGELKLGGMEYLQDCEGRTFQTLLLKYQNRIEDTQLTFNVIAPTTPISVKFEIFKRINEGGKPLNRQEIRNSMARPVIRNFIKSLAISEEFKEATDNSIKPIRMEDQELVLRYVGFYIIKFVDTSRTYKGDMESFLDDTLDYLNNKSSSQLLEQLRTGFYEAMNNAVYLFGKFAFRKIMPVNIEKNKRSLVNKSLFTVWSVMLSKVNVSVRTNFPRLHLAELIAQQIESDSVYFDALTTGTNQANKISYGFQVAESIINQNLENDA